MVSARSTTLEELHCELRQRILSGQLSPGTPISQVELSRELGVSRTPLREVLRMLQQEGLVVAEPHRRVRVADLGLPDLEQVYTHRILLESLSVSLTVQRRIPSELEEIYAALHEMRTLTGGEEWEVAHQRFHRALVAEAPGLLRETILRLQERARSYRHLYAQVLSDDTLRRPVGMSDHERIVAAIEAGDALGACEQLAKHLGRTALTLMAELAPQHDPGIVRSALQMVVRGDLPLNSLAHLPTYDRPAAFVPTATDGEGVE